MRRAALALLTVVAAAGTARADAFAELPEGAIAYASARPVAVVGAMQRLGLDRLPAIQRFKKQLGGIDPFNPVIMAAPGIDVAAPVVASVFESVVGLGMHTRVVAQLRDKPTFGTFVMGVIASGQLPLTAAPAIKDAVAMGSPSPSTVMLLRVIGTEALLDVVEVDDGKKAPPAAELARRFPLQPARKFVPGHGARRLFSPDATVVLYVDARKLEPMFVQMGAADRKRELAAATGAERAQVLARQRNHDKQCALWKRAPSLFDDAALALAATPDAVTLTWAWGTQAGPPLGGLKLTSVDDGAIDGSAIGRDGAGMFALYAASLTPFTSLKRTGLFASPDAFSAAVDGCDTQAGLLLLLRSWPLALGTLAGSTPPAGSPLVMLKQSLATLRNVVVGLRDFNASGPRIAVAASFDQSTRGSFEMMLAAFGGGSGAVTKIGLRSPTIYSVKLPDSARPPLAVGLETLPAGRFSLSVADSDESLAWAYKAGDSATARAAHPPLARLSADATLLTRLGPMLGADADQQSLLDILAHLRRVDGTLATDGDLFSLTLHAPLKP